MVLRLSCESLMAKPYSYDFRQKVIQALELDGLKKSEVSELFNISRNTIDLWLKRQTETGDFQELPKHRPGHSHRITDWEEFRAFVKRHGDKTQAEMAQLWEGNISERTVSRALAKIGFTRKKRPPVTGNALRQSDKRLLSRLPV